MVRNVRTSRSNTLSITSPNRLPSGRTRPFAGWPQAWQCGPSNGVRQLRHASGAGASAPAWAAVSFIGILLRAAKMAAPARRRQRASFRQPTPMHPETLPSPRFREEVARTARLAAPLAAGHLSHGLVGFIDTVVAGHHGTATLAAVAVGAALFWLPMMMPMGTLMALPPSVSQLDGAGRRDEIGPLFRQALWLAAGLGALLFALMSLLPLALGPMGIAADIVPGATAFIHAIRWGIPGFTLYLCMRYLSDGLHWSMPTMLLGFGGLLLLAPVGYVLTNGLLG